VVLRHALKQSECLSVISRRNDSNYTPYQKFNTPSPYKPRRGGTRVNAIKIYDGGVLPRPEGKWEDIPLPMPAWDRAKVDAWTTKKALFGQNDYIDILGDGTVHPWELIRAPAWLKGYRGNELQRISRELATQGTFLRETFPSKYHTLTKQLFYLYKKLNRRHHAPFFGGYQRYSRIDKPKLRH